jgi:predicted PurR-regulated permease PerM
MMIAEEFLRVPRRRLSIRAPSAISTVILLSCHLLAGCAASGVQVSEQQAQSFQVGRSTYADVVATLGEPTTSTVSSNGQRMAIYSYAAVQARPQNFIPYIGSLVAGYDTTSSAVVFMFDQRGVLASTSSTKSGMGTGANLAAGAPVNQTAQPR